MVDPEVSFTQRFHCNLVVLYMYYMYCTCTIVNINMEVVVIVLCWQKSYNIVSFFTDNLIFTIIEPRKQFEIVFRMIDVDGSDSIDLKEFEEVNSYWETYVCSPWDLHV